MADDTDKSDFTDDDAISGNDNPSSSKQAQHSQYCCTIITKYNQFLSSQDMSLPA